MPLFWTIYNIEELAGFLMQNHQSVNWLMADICPPIPQKCATGNVLKNFISHTHTRTQHKFCKKWVTEQKNSWFTIQGDYARQYIFSENVETKWRRSRLHLWMVVIDFVFRSTVYSVQWIPPTLRLIFKAKVFIGVGIFSTQRLKFKVRFFLRTKIRESTKRNNLLMSGVWRNSTISILVVMLVLRYLLWSELILLCELMGISWKMTENIRHTLKNERKSTPWLAKGDWLVGYLLLSGMN